MYIHLIKIGLFSLKLKMFYFYENKDTKNMSYFLQGLDLLNTLSSLPPICGYTHTASQRGQIYPVDIQEIIHSRIDIMLTL